MSNNQSNFLATIVPAMGSGKHAILTDEASTIVEKYKHPVKKSVVKKKKVKEYLGGGKTATGKVVAESISRPTNGKDASLEKYVKNSVESVNPSNYVKTDKKRFSEYLGVKSPERTVISVDTDNEEEMEEGEYKVVANEFGEYPEIYLDGCDVKELSMYSTGDYIKLSLYGEVKNISFESDDKGKERYVYGLEFNSYKIEED